MPSLRKKSLSLFIRNGCERQYILSLYTPKERRTHGMPPHQDVRAALGLAGVAGIDWQAQKLSEVKDVFGKPNVHENTATAGKLPDKIEVLDVLDKLKPNQFIVEGTYETDTNTFRSAVGLISLTDSFGNIVGIEKSRPDLIQVLPPLSDGTGPASEEKPNPYELGVRPNGDVFLLDPNDSRLRLRVIDIKLTSEPGAHYFAEVVYYSISLAAWLIEQKKDSAFVVVAAPAVWPGAHDASNLAKQFAEWGRKAYLPAAADMAKVLEKDLEIAPFDVFAPRLRRFFAEQLPYMLNKPWQDLEWHVDYRCKGCEFLGYPWIDKTGNVHNNPLQCWPTADSLGHLSRVVGLSPGASEQLRQGKVNDVNSLASTSSSASVFDEHQGLRAKRTSFPHRAGALQNKTTSIIPDSGGDALMPRNPALHIYIFLDYDLSSAITVSIAIRAFWHEQLPYGSTLPGASKVWTKREGAHEVFLVDSQSVDRERNEFLKFLRQLRQILDWVLKQDEKDTLDGRRDKKTAHSTYQIYLWDESQRKHLVRLVGRHLPHILADPKLRGLAWLFPPSELLQNPEDATRRSPLTIVSKVIENTVAVPLPHYYRLLDVASTYKRVTAGIPSVHPLYQEPMSDLIPVERIHEYWERFGDWLERERPIEEAARSKAYALSLVVERLEDDLKTVLSRQAAPPVHRSLRPMTGLAPQGRLWLEYTRLNAALDSLEAHTTRSMPPHEREARLKSARLTRRLSGIEEHQALDEISRTLGRSITPGQDIFVYKMSDASREVNVKPGDFTCALAPEGQHGFLDDHPYPYIKGTSLEGVVPGAAKAGTTIAEVGMTGVSIEAIDRVGGVIVLRAGDRCCIRLLELVAGLDFSRDVILDPVHRDYLTKKVELTVQGIGNPPSAVADPRVLEALGPLAGTSGGTTASSPAAEVLWEAPALHGQPTGRSLPAIKSKLTSYFSSKSTGLDFSQWEAWEAALSLRFSLVWGPPGTGKSRTLGAVALGAVLDALATKRPMRLLITANTYTAVDNVLLDVEKDLKGLLSGAVCDVYRIQSKWHTSTTDLSIDHPDLNDLTLNTAKPSDEIKVLRERLEKPAGIVVVGCVPQQLHNLSVAGKSKTKPRDTIRSWFDLIVLDEASQMDVATSTLIFTKLTPDGSCVLAGDDLQLPPIQQAEPPQDLEHTVGSVYNYFRHHHDIEPNSLDINYRSNSTIVEFTRMAGYSPKLKSYSPDLKLHLSSLIPALKPHDWPTQLYWSPEWGKFLDPDYPAICFIYDDRLSSQTNDFEADAVAALLWLLQGRLSDKLKNEKKPDGSIDSTVSSTHYQAKDFWGKAVGVVTPHRAQMAKTVYRLQQVFPTHDPNNIRNAVDTVERFQGQQRDVIIASFGLGDPDIISSEDEFLYNLNRFNVLTSRARAKIIVFVTRSLLEHLSNDADVLKESRLLKQFAESYCTQRQIVQVGYIKDKKDAHRTGELRRK
jgi:hypothetical protein